MAEHRVTGVNKPDRDNRVEAIVSLCGPGWHYERLEVVRRIKSGFDTFYTEFHGRRAYLRAYRSQYGTEYVATDADATDANNLLNLPACR